jgi:hypothetical protein
MVFARTLFGDAATGEEGHHMTTRTLSNPTGRLVAEHPNAVRLGRAGWAAKGAVYLIAGVLAAAVVLASFGWSTPTASQEASPTGAIKTIAGSPGGVLLLWLLAIALLLYAAWRVVSAFIPGHHDAESTAKRAGYLVSAVIYATFAITAIALATSDSATADPNAQDGNAKVTNLTARLMGNGGGRILIGAVGVIAIGAGIYRLVKGFRQDVDDELDLSGMSPARARWTQRLGAIGEVGRGVAITVIGVFLLRAAIDVDPNEATGLDGALRRLVNETWGAIVVAVIAIGFVAYGIFCLATFTRRRLEAP